MVFNYNSFVSVVRRAFSEEVSSNVSEDFARQDCTDCFYKTCTHMAWVRNVFDVKISQAVVDKIVVVSSINDDFVL